MRHCKIGPQRYSVAILSAMLMLWILCTASPGLSKETTSIDPADKARTEESYGKLPLYFIQNNGQVDDTIQFYEKGSGHSTFFAKDGVYLMLTRKKENNNKDTQLTDILSPAGIGQGDGDNAEDTLSSHLVKLSFLNANPNPRIVSEEKQDGVVNYFIGNDPSKWQTGVPTYQVIVYKEVYPGIDIKFYGNNRQMEYDIVVKPGADPSKVKLAYEGIERLEVADNGDLEIILKEGKVVQKKPHIYQEIEERQVKVDGSFRIFNDVAATDGLPESLLEKSSLPGQNDKTTNTEDEHEQRFIYTFEIASYDKDHLLIIDPILVYSTYFGGSHDDYGCCIDIDASGNAYIMGPTVSTNIPATPGAYDLTHNGGWWDEFIVKLDASGSSLVYATYLGGSGYDYGNSIAVDATGNLYITGATNSTNFPTTTGVYDTTYNGNNDVFVTKLNQNGSALLYSTLIGGSDNDGGGGIALDASGNAYISGHTSSMDFPITSGAYDTTYNGNGDVFVTKLNQNGSVLLYSTLVGGSNEENLEAPRPIALDVSGNVYMTGWTSSTDFPTTPGAYDATFNGVKDVFVSKLNSTGSALSYSTYLGGSGDERALDISVDASGNAYVTGYTGSADFPTTAGAYDTTYNGGIWDGFVAKLDPSGSGLFYSTYLGGSGEDSGHGIAVDGSGNAYVTGWTFSSNFPTTPGAYDTTFNGGGDGFLIKLDASGSVLTDSTYIGGSNFDVGAKIALDASGNAYVIGRTESTDFPATSGAYDTTPNGLSDVFLMKFSFPVSLDMNNWMKMECGPWENTVEGLKVHGTYYRGGNLIKTKTAYNFIGKELFIKWKVNNGGSFSAYGVGLFGIDLETSYSSPNACCQPYTKAITNDTWYYTRIKINPDKTAQHVTSTNDYDINRGTVFASGTKTIPDSQWQMVDKTNIFFVEGDTYAGSNAYFVIGEVVTDAIPVTVNIGGTTTYDFEDSIIPASFYSTGNWTVANYGYNSSHSLYINTSQTSTISLYVTDAVAVSFKTRVNAPTYSGSGFEIIDQGNTQANYWWAGQDFLCWNDIYFNIYGSGTKTLRWYLFNNGSGGGETWIDDIKIYYPDVTEVCDGIDNDGDGLIDEGFTDTDSDGQADCVDADDDNDGYSDDVEIATGSDPLNAASTPEVCDGADNDMDGLIDEGVTITYYQDADNDTYGNPSFSIEACTAPSGYISDNTDCNDNNSSINPSATEVCNGVDDNCNGQVDEGVLVTYNPTADFSINNGNPNSVWAYGWMPNDFSTFSLYTGSQMNFSSPQWYREPVSADFSPMIWRIDDSYPRNGVSPGQLSLHPSNTFEPSVLRWTAPSDGLYNFAGQFLSGDGNPTIQVGIRQDSNWLWQGVDSGIFNLDRLMTTGESIDFLVYGNYWAGNTPLELTVSSEACQAPSQPNLSNISTRGMVQTGDDVMIGGFIIEGTGNKTVLIRARGPSLTDFGVSGAMANPTLELYSGQTVIAKNNDWQTTDPQCDAPATSCGNDQDIQDTGLDPCSVTSTECTLDSAIYVTLPPGGYTAILSEVNNGTGVGIVEVFDVDSGSSSILTNISTRGPVLTGDSVMIGGFIVSGGDKTVLLRARGPSLADFEVSGAMANPILELYSGQTMIAANNDWQTTDPQCAAPLIACGNATDIQNTGLDPCSVTDTGCTLDSAMYVTLPPGGYTAILKGANNGTGVGIVEMFEVVP